MTAAPGFFSVDRTPQGDVLTPLPTAAGNWGPNRMRGLAVMSRDVVDGVATTDM